MSAGDCGSLSEPSEAVDTVGKGGAAPAVFCCSCWSMETRLDSFDGLYPARGGPDRGSSSSSSGPYDALDLACGASSGERLTRSSLVRVKVRVRLGVGASVAYTKFGFSIAPSGSATLSTAATGLWSEVVTPAPTTGMG